MSQINLHVSAQTRFREVGDAVSPIASSGRRWAGTGLPPALHRQDGQVGPIHTNRLAQDRLVVLNGRQERRPLEWRDTGLDAANARDIIAFIHALGAEQVDIFGFSIGGMVAQQIALDAPELVRRLILVGTGPSGGEGMAAFSPQVQEIMSRPNSTPAERGLALFFSPTATSQAAGKAWIARITARQVDREPPASPQVAAAQLAALKAWGR